MTVLSKSPTPAELSGPKDTKNVEIPEVIVGAILGNPYYSIHGYSNPYQYYQPWWLQVEAVGSNNWNENIS